MNEQLGPDDVDRLLSGELHPDDAPPELAEVARTLQRARASAGESEMVGRVGAIRTMASGPAPTGSGRRLPALLAGKAAILAALLFGGAAAAGVVAAGDGEPVAVEETTTTMAEPTTTVSPTTTEAETTTTEVTTTVAPPTTVAPAPAVPDDSEDQGEGPDPNGPAHKGLCTAFGHRDEQPGGSVAYRNLAVAAMEAGQTIGEFCSDVADLRDEKSEKSEKEAEHSEADDDSGQGRGHRRGDSSDGGDDSSE